MTMKLKKIYTILFVSFALTGCDFLDFDESSGMDKEEAYAYFDNVTRMVSGVYRAVPSDWGKISDALRESATDNAVYTWTNNAVWKIYSNAWSPINLVDDRWEEFYQVIHDANSLMENFSEENLKRYEWDKDYADNTKRIRAYMKEVEVLRAYYHFELAKRYGDVPLMTRTYAMDEINHVEKTSFDDIIAFVNSEIERLLPDLVKDQNELFGETGHINKGIALAA